MKFKHLLFIVFGLFFSNSQAQVSAYINGKEVKSGATVSKSDLASLQVSFKNPKKITVISGASVLYVNLLDAKKKSIQQFYIQKDGYIAIEDFLKNTPAQKKFNVFGEGEFSKYGNTLDWILTSAAGIEDQKTIQVKVGFYVVQETGYKEYGPQVQLLEPLVFNVPVWDEKKLFLPYLDLTLDKTNIPGDIDLEQNGSSSSKDTEFGYRLKDAKKIFYGVYAIDNTDYSGMNIQELANDFIHEATLVANQGYKVDFKDYALDKYNLPWRDINGLKNSSTNLYRLHNLSFKVNKELKKMDLMTLYTPVEINGLKGYMYSDDVEDREHINSSDWKPVGKFKIYILTHPTNPKLTLVVSSDLYGNDVKSVEEVDAYLKVIINSFKH